MKMQILCLEDLQGILGKYIFRCNVAEPSKKLQGYKWSFVQEKRLFIPVKAFTAKDDKFYNLMHIWGEMVYKEFKTFEEMRDCFNCETNSEIAEKEQRFYRLLTSSELDYLFQKLKETNY